MGPAFALSSIEVALSSSRQLRWSRSDVLIHAHVMMGLGLPKTSQGELPALSELLEIEKLPACHHEIADRLAELHTLV